MGKVKTEEPPPVVFFNELFNTKKKLKVDLPKSRSVSIKWNTKNRKLADVDSMVDKVLNQMNRTKTKHFKKLDSYQSVISRQKSIVSD